MEKYYTNYFYYSRRKHKLIAHIPERNTEEFLNLKPCACTQQGIAGGTGDERTCTWLINQNFTSLDLCKPEGVPPPFCQSRGPTCH